jgi:hypothetical protein
MTSFLNWLAGVIARWLNPKDTPVTTVKLDLTPAETVLAERVGSITNDLGVFGSDVVTFWNALVAAAKPGFANLSDDAMAAGYFLVLLTEVAADIPSPISTAAAMALTVEKIALVNAPKIVALGKLLAVLASFSGMDIRGAYPDEIPHAPAGGNRGPV